MVIIKSLYQVIEHKIVRGSIMSMIKKFTKELCISLILAGATLTHAYGETGNAEAMISDSDAYRNIIGIGLSETTPTQGAITGCNGVYVSAVIPGHPASVAGLKIGDIITRINSFGVTTKSDALEVMEALEAGVSYPFEVCRLVAGQPQRLTIKILVEKVQEKAIEKIS
jgi:C-terminal processing protease CtpA/Prc